MAFSEVSAIVFIVFVSISSVSQILACGSCSTLVKPPKHKTPTFKPPVHLPLVVVPVPPVGGLPLIGKLPPVGSLPHVTVPPIISPTATPYAPPPVKPDNCPINILNVGACMDLLSGAVRIGLGDPALNACCPVLKGLAELEAAACLCTTLKVKLFNLKVYVPIALQILLSCGKTPPPGYTCSI